ncbi:Hypothetical predicted protein [Lecanosticta acicola]|uniref:Uncharacterized protein n=1 Tax=Lecanosticta acicola TaxID=111012 RepID=A0AAI8Z5M6_9PEZI|nr:Hypothetical predicted protein [Lecanosticta acicola]
MHFFMGWATWEKLVFVSTAGPEFRNAASLACMTSPANSCIEILACAIFVTVLLGCIKLGYSRWKLRKYMAVAEKERREQGMRRSVSQRRRQEAAEGTDEPFGIKAIERGREVEGVWNSSGHNTPRASREDSGASSLWSDVPLKDRPLLDIEKQDVQPSHDPTGPVSTTGTVPPASSALDHSISRERAVSLPPSRDSSPAAAITRPPKSRHPPSSLSKYDINSHILRQDSATLTLKGIDAVHDAFGTLRGHGDGSGDDNYGSNESSNQSSYGSTDNEPIAASAPRLLNHQPRSRPRQHSSDLDLMQSHRNSQAAETGQFTPRFRRPGPSGDWSNFSRISHTTPTESNDYFSQQRKESPSITDENAVSHAKGKHVSPIDTLPAAVRRSSLPDVTPFAKFCQTAPSSPISPPGIAYDRETPRLRSDSTNIHASAPSSPATVVPLAELPATVPISSPPQPSTQQSPAAPGAVQQTRTSFERRASSVLRGHGTGFEILKAGTLKPVIPGENAVDRPNAGPPVNLHDSSDSRPRSSSTDSRRKLRKKRWPSADGEGGSRTSMTG